MAIQNDFGVFLPTTAVFDPESLVALNNDPKFKELVIFITQQYNNIANVVNLKETGYYITTEIVNSQFWFNPNVTAVDQSIFRNDFRTVVNFGALPNATTKTVPHNIPNFIPGVASWTRIYATATDATGAGIPIPYASSVLNENIIISVDDTNIYITTAIDYSNFTITYVVLEYLKN